MAAACPTDAQLETFARGEGDPVSRAELANHIRGCADCQARYLPIALQSQSMLTTNFDSPSAKARKHSRETPVRSMTDSITAVTQSGSGMEDTHVSGERDLRALTTSGIQRGEALDRYVILERLGAGGMGEVYAAWDPVLDRKVAVKVLKPDFEGSELGEELTQRLLSEAQSLAKLNHPNVVTVHDVGISGERVYLAMEFAEGRTIKQWLEQKPKPTWRATLEVFLAAGEGLAAAHDQGITHRDFKPDNVIVGADGRVRVMDFGLAHGKTKKKDAGGRTITQPGAMLGTPAYMSLEALHGKPTDFRSDEFCFCASLYEAFYGYRPFEGDSPAALAVEIAQNRVREVPKDTKVPRRIHQLIVKGLRADPGERFQTMRALLVQLGRRRGDRERSLAVVAVAVLAIVAVGLTALASYRARTRCAEVESRLDGVWDASTKKQVRAAFEATQKPWAAAAWRDVEARLDTYSRDWASQRRAACEESFERSDEQLGQEIVCLSRRLSDLEATTQLFTRADADVVERASTTAGSLAPVASCKHAGVVARKRTEVESTRARLSAIRARIDAGKYAEATGLATELATAAAANGEQSAFAEARLLMAIGKMRSGDAKSADALVEEAILAAQAAQDDELQALASVERVGFAATTATQQDADRWIRFARAAVDRVGKPQELEAGLAANQGAVAYYRGQYADAVTAYQGALELRIGLLGDTHPLVARTHSNLGTAFKNLGQFDKARASYERALAIEEATLDPSHPQVADTLNNLGNVLQAQRSLSDARSFFERSLRIKEAAYGADSLPVAVTSGNLGALLLELGDLPAAEKALQRALEIKEQRTGPDSITVAVSLTNLAQARRAARRWEDAIALDERALAIRRVRQGEQHQDLAWNLTGLGEARLMTKDVTGARPALEQALTLRRDRGPLRAETAYWLARALEGTKDTRRRSLLEEAVADLPPSDRLAPLASAALEKR